MPEWRITEHAGASGLAELEPEWRELAGSMARGRAHHSYEAAAAYATHLLDPSESMRYLALRDESRLRAVCPLRRGADRVLGVPVRILSTPWGGEWPLGDAVCDEDDACAALLPAVIEYLGRAHDAPALVAVGPAEATSRLWDGADAAGPHVAYDEGATNRIDCTGDFDEYHSALSKNFRNNLRKARNKLAKLADVRVVTVTEPGDVERELEVFIRLEGAGWKGSTKGGEALCLSAANVEFFRGLFVGLAASGRSEINALYADGRCIASQLCIRSGDLYEMYKIAFDAAFAPQAPGQMLFEDTLRRCFADGTLASVDLMSDTPWHHDWRPSRIPLRRAYFSTGGLAGAALLPMVRFRFGPARRLARRFAGTRATR